MPRDFVLMASVNGADLENGLACCFCECTSDKLLIPGVSLWQENFTDPYQATESGWIPFARSVVGQAWDPRVVPYPGILAIFDNLQQSLLKKRFNIHPTPPKPSPPISDGVVK
ncbi:stringent starvation protein B-like protein [Striga asiatica]|uniref:Stringent starvation protein B-like protein n=1 Tax=Striga asiatica TaxID=4170 RepID=A0A5A7PBM4_STRAF|nr:stringent starvation protein B-like protein [Striga asiatica]